MQHCSDHCQLSCVQQKLLFVSFLRTPPFSSEEESEDDVTEEDEEQPLKHQQGKSPPPRFNQATQIQTRADKASPVQDRQAVVRQLPISSIQYSKVGGVTKTAVTKLNSDEEEDDWSEVSEQQETDLQNYKDQNGNVEKKNHGKG